MKNKNFLDYKPVKIVPFEINNNIVEIKMENKGFFKRLTQILLKKPKYSYIKLDKKGSLIWKEIDGLKTIYQISLKLTPTPYLYENLCNYMKILKHYKFITYK